MNKIKKNFRLVLIPLFIWLGCLGFYMHASVQDSGYTIQPVLSEADVEDHRWFDCSGPYYSSSSESPGYLCDGYAPNSFLWGVIAAGVIFFFLTLMTFFAILVT